jgi:hypothetical protein
MSTFGQDYPRKELNVRDFIQELVGSPDGGVNEDLYESLYQNYLNPIDLNSISREEMASLYILSEKQLNNFFAYRSQTGKLLSIYELQAIPDFDLRTIYRLVPFVIVKPDGLSFGAITDALNSDKQYLLLRYAQILETKKGFTPPTSTSKVRYQGSSQKLYARYKWYSSKDFSVGFTVEKDEGESTLTDFTSFHLQLKNKGALKNMIVGDYQLQFGQGLVTSAGFYIGKGSETVLTVRRSNLGAKPYSSAMEMNFFRGGVATYQLGKFEVTGFYSGLNRDANMVRDSLGNSLYATSLQTSGLHRTTSESEDRKGLFEQNMGTNVSYQSTNGALQLGLTFLQTSFNKELTKADKPYNFYEFSGDKSSLIGLNYNYNYQNVNFFGEIARSQSGGIGLVTGMLASFKKGTDIALLFRKYDPNFHSFYSNGFSENTRNINETGYYVGLRHWLNRKWQLSSYADYFYFPWYRYLVDKQTTKGFDVLARILYQPNKRMQAFFQVRQENKEENTKITEEYTDSKGKLKIREITVVRNRIRRVLLANLDYKLSKIWSFQTRASFSTFQFAEQALTNGFALAQDVSADLGKFSLSGRVAVFNTDDYDNRQYFYEQDVLYAFSFPAYYQHGIRHYLMLQYKVSKNIDAWLRWARTDLFGENSFGSGLDEIATPHRSEVKLQLRIHW